MEGFVFAPRLLPKPSHPHGIQGLDLEKIDKAKVGVIWGSGVGGLETFHATSLRSFIKEYK